MGKRGEVAPGSFQRFVLGLEQVQFGDGASTSEQHPAQIAVTGAEVGATSMKEMGKVMGVASKRLAGRADGKDISAKVRELLA